MATQKKSWLNKVTEGNPVPYLLGFGIMAVLILMMYLFAITGWTMYGQNVHKASNIWVPVGLAIQATGVIIAIKGNNSRYGIQAGHIIALAVAMAFGFAAFAGFNFSVA